MMREGASIDPWYEPGFSEVPFYPFESDEARYRGMVAASRARDAHTHVVLEVGVRLGSEQQTRRGVPTVGAARLPGSRAAGPGGAVCGSGGNGWERGQPVGVG